MITSGSVTSIIKILFAFLEIQISISGCDHSETSDSGSYLIEAGNSLSYSEAMIRFLIYTGGRSDFLGDPVTGYGASKMTPVPTCRKG